jgi:hypothetical protein
MINREVILAGCRAYVQATGAWTQADPQGAEDAAQALANGQTVPGMLTMTGPLLAALAAAVDADRHDWDAVTRQYT